MKFINGLVRYFDKSGKLRMLNYLRGASDSELQQWGYSPTLLQKGISAWPWRQDEQPSIKLATEQTLANVQHNVKELEQLSDAKLANVA